MADLTAIEWTDSTVNFWWGCTKVSPGCDHCYAETWNDFRGNKQWGPGAPRREIKGAAASIRRLQRQAPQFFTEHGRARRVFLQSMSDNFDNEVTADLRDTMFAEAEAAYGLEIQMLTKRVSNVGKMVPAHWKTGGWPRHIGLMITVTSQKEADRDIPRLLELKREYNIPWVGISIEPMLGRVSLRDIHIGKLIYLDALTGKFKRKARNGLTDPMEHIADLPVLDWVITGGESGPGARPMHPDWVMVLRDQCAATGTAFLFKQWGNWKPISEMGPTEPISPKVLQLVLHRDGSTRSDVPNGPMTMFNVGKKAAGRTLRGRTHTEFPRRAA